MNEYLSPKTPTKNGLKTWLIFTPLWFVTSVIATALADAIESDHHLFAAILRFVPIIAIPLWLYLALKLVGFQGPNHLKCQKCNAPAFDRPYDNDEKFNGPTRAFLDICSNCGNNNSLDLHDS